MRECVLILLQSLGAAEIDQLDISIDVEHDVLALDIAMCEEEAMHRERTALRAYRCTTLLA